MNEVTVPSVVSKTEIVINRTLNKDIYTWCILILKDGSSVCGKPHVTIAGELYDKHRAETESKRNSILELPNIELNRLT